MDRRSSDHLLRADISTGTIPKMNSGLPHLPVTLLVLACSGLVMAFVPMVERTVESSGEETSLKNNVPAEVPSVDQRSGPVTGE